MADRRDRDIDELRRRVAAGEYEVDPRAVADAILRRARARERFAWERALHGDVLRDPRGHETTDPRQAGQGRRRMAA